MLNDGSFYDAESWLDVRKRNDEDRPQNAHAFVTGGNIEIRSYNLKTASEVKTETLISRQSTTNLVFWHEIPLQESSTAGNTAQGLSYG